RRRHTRSKRDWSSDVCSSDLYRKAIRLTAQISSIVASMGRLQTGGGLIDPDPVLGHAANFLYMLTGERPSGLATRAFDVALILRSEERRVGKGGRWRRTR